MILLFGSPTGGREIRGMFDFRGVFENIEQLIQSKILDEIIKLPQWFWHIKADTKDTAIGDQSDNRWLPAISLDEEYLPSVHEYIRHWYNSDHNNIPLPYRWVKEDFNVENELQEATKQVLSKP